MNLNCIICNVQFYVSPYRIKQKPKYCSGKCYGLGKMGNKPWNKGKPWSKDAREKMSLTRKAGIAEGKIVAWNKKERNLIACEYCSVPFYPKYLYNKNKYCSKDCASKDRVNIPSPLKGIKKPEFSAENHPNWKGDLVSYSGLHKWIAAQLGSPSECEHCKTTKSKRFEWANKSQKYKRDVTDWLRLCVVCHKKYDDDYRKLEAIPSS